MLFFRRKEKVVDTEARDAIEEICNILGLHTSWGNRHHAVYGGGQNLSNLDERMKLLFEHLGIKYQGCSSKFEPATIVKVTE